jgi:hypothetical protein
VHFPSRRPVRQRAGTKDQLVELLGVIHALPSSPGHPRQPVVS